jgi:hypothetical protein
MSAVRAEDPLDSLLRRHLVLDPPSELQSSLLSAALAEVGSTALSPRAVTLAEPADDTMPWFVASSVPRLSLGTYGLLAVLVAVYVAMVRSLGMDWPLVAAWEVYAVISFVLRTPAGPVIGGLVGGLGDRLAWLALVPIVWHLWRSDRAALRPTPSS